MSGAVISEAYSKDYTLFMQACMKGSIDIVKREWEIDKENVKLKINNQRGWNSVTALMLAAHAQNIKVVEFLLDIGADIKLTNTLGSNCLMLAAEEGHLDIVKMLHEYDSKRESEKKDWLIRGTTKNGQTALMLAIESDNNNHYSKYQEVIKYIISIDMEWQLKHRNCFDKWYVRYPKYNKFKYVVCPINTLPLLSQGPL